MKHFLLFLLLLTGLYARAATITGPISLAYSNAPYVGPILFRPLSTPLPYTPTLITGGDFTVRPGTNGTFSVDLQPGNYRVQVGADRAFVIDVPTNAATYTLLERITNSLSWNSSISPRTNSYATANDTIEGVVRTYTTQASPVVWTTNDWAAMGHYAGLYVFTNVAQMVASTVPVQSLVVVRVLGYYTANDGGGGDYLWDASSSAVTNIVSPIAPESGSGRYSAMWNGAGSEVNVRRAGLKGDSTNDDTVRLQGAIDFAEAQTPTWNLVYPSGDYSITSVVLKRASHKGISQSNLHTLGSQKTGARITQRIGATNDCFIVNADHLTGLEISNLDFVGNREDNLKNPFLISAASTRTNFTVNPTSGTWPTAPASPSVWPYYGYCFFFTSENKYAGAGLVVNRNTGTGAIDLMPFSDTYSTVTNGGYLLSAGWKVCFAEVATETSGYKTTTGIDSSKAGYNGINIYSDSVHKLVTKLRLNNLRMWHWHTAIRMGNTLANTLQDIWIGTASFAGIAGAFPGDNRDDILNNVFIQGYWLRSNNTIPETLILENQSMRKTLWGIYGLTSSGNMEVTTLDNTVNGLFVKDCLETKVGALHIDGPLQNGIWFGGGLTGVKRSQSTFSSVVMRNINLASDLLVGPVNNNPYYGINIFGTANSAVINQLDITEFGANNRYYTAAFHAPVQNGVHVNNLFTVAGATNMFSAGTTFHPSIGLYHETPDLMYPIVGGVNPYRIEAAQFTTTSPLVASNTFNARNVATMESNTWVLGSLRVGTNVSIPKYRVFEKGFNAVDSMGIFHYFGADDSTGDARSGLTKKEWRFYGYDYDTNAPKYLAIWGFSDLTSNKILIPGNDGTAGAVTDVEFGTAARGTLGVTNRLRIDSVGNIIIPDTSKLRFTDANGVLKLSGSGSPEGVHSGPKGSTYQRNDGGTSTSFYVKESGSGNTGWVAYGPPGAGGVASSRQILTQHSLTGGGDLSADRTLNLVNDTASPGNNKVYGTDGSGVRGWKNDPSGSGGLTDGSKGEITVSGSGTVFTLTNGLSKQFNGLAVNGTFEYTNSAPIMSVNAMNGASGFRIDITGTSSTLLRLQESAATKYQFGSGSDRSILLGTLLDSSPLDGAIEAAGATGTDVDGGNLLLKAGRSTGAAGTKGRILFQTPDSVASGTTQQTPSTKVSIEKQGQINLVSRTADPTISYSNGSVFYRSDLHKFRVRYNGIAANLLTEDLAATTYQPLDAELTALASITSAADTLAYFSGSGTATTTPLTSAGRALVDDADASAQRTTLGLGTVATESTVPIAKGGTGQTTAKAAYDALNGAEATVASATTTDLGAASSDKVSITGTTTITGFGTVAAGVKREGRFTGALTLTHNATSLIVPGAASITTAAGDRFQAYSLGSGNWVVSSYTKADGTAVVGGGGAGTKTIAVWDAKENEPPSTSYATLFYRNVHPTLAFDTASQEVAIFRGRIPEGAVLTSGVTVYAQWAASSATSGTIGWDISFERLTSGGQNLDTDAFGTAQTITAATVSGTSGITTTTSVNFSQAQLPTSLAAGDMYRIRIRRDVANDTAAGDAQLVQLEVRLQ